MRKLRRFLWKHGVIIYRAISGDCELLLWRLHEADRILDVESAGQVDAPQQELSWYKEKTNESGEVGTRNAPTGIVPNSEKDWLSEKTIEMKFTDL